MALEHFGTYYPTTQVTLEWALYVLARREAEEPLIEPVTEAELRQQLRCDPAMPAAYVMRLGKAAREIIERYCNRVWIEQELEVSCHVLRPILPLPLAHPLRHIVDVLYLDAEGEAHAITDYKLSYLAYPPAIDLTGAPESHYYSVAYRAGLAAAPPEDIRHAILATASWLFAEDPALEPRARPQLLPPSVRLICDVYRLETYSV